MRLPALAVTAAFACGVVLGHLWLGGVLSVSSASFGILFLGVLALILAGIELVRRGKLVAAAMAALCGWIFLGATAERIARHPLPQSHVLSLLNAHRIDLQSPLRWQGRLRDEPRRLPWGYGLDVDLAQVEYRSTTLATEGGLRLSYSPGDGNSPLPELHAGDVAQFTTRARLPTVFRNEGAFDRRAYLAQQGIHLVANLRAVELISRVTPASAWPHFWIARVRAHLRDEVDSLLHSAPNLAGVLRAMLLGDRSFVDREESRSFQSTGTFHVVVIAGLHVSALALFLYFCGRTFRLSRGLTAFLTLALLIAYVAVVEVRPPVVRATLMAAVVVAGRLFFRRLELLNSAAVAALLILLVRPLELFDSSFQLSFLAMACIGGLAAPWLNRTAEPYVRALRGWRDVTRDASHAPLPTQFRIDLRSLDRWLASGLPASAARAPGSAVVAFTSLSFRVWEIFVLSLVLQIGMLPMMAQQFHRITLAGPFANLFAVPITGILVPVGFVTLGASLLYHQAATLLAVPLVWLTRLLVRVVGWFASFWHWSYRIPGPPWWVSVLFFVAFVVVAAALRQGARKTFRIALACMVLCAIVIAAYPFAPRLAGGSLEVTVLDVGQGDSIFVVFPLGKTMLIDGGGAFGGFRGQAQFAGPDPGEDAVSPYLWSRGVQRLDVVALTHAHEDHIGGLRAILENFHVGSLWVGREVASPAFVALEDLAARRDIPVVREMRGRSFDWDGTRGEVLWPEIASGELVPSAKNDDSLVMRVAYGNRVVLLPGDIEQQAERQILAKTSGGALRADVLKAGHHGSKNSTTPEFLERVRPRVALISAGAENPYGHPSSELLERLAQAGVRILRTDQNGAIHVLTDGDSLRVWCYAPCADAPQREASSGSQPADEDKHR